MGLEDGDATPLLSPRVARGLGPVPSAPRAQLLRLPSADAAEGATAGPLPCANVVAHLLRSTSDDFWRM